MALMTTEGQGRNKLYTTCHSPARTGVETDKNTVFCLLFVIVQRENVVISESYIRPLSSKHKIFAHMMSLSNLSSKVVGCRPNTRSLIFARDLELFSTPHSRTTPNILANGFKSYVSQSHEALVIIHGTVGVYRVKVKSCPCLVNHHVMKPYWVVEVYLHAFLTSALDGGEWSASLPGRFTPGERTLSTHRIGGWMGPRTGLDPVVKRKIPSPCRESNPDRPARSLVLYRLSYPAYCHRYYNWKPILTVLRICLSLLSAAFLTFHLCCYVP
jgi:hypothetical protein